RSTSANRAGTRGGRPGRRQCSGSRPCPWGTRASRRACGSSCARRLCSLQPSGGWEIASLCDHSLDLGRARQGEWLLLRQSDGEDDLLREVVEQRLRVLQVARVEAFGEPGVDRGEEGAGLVALALTLPEPRQAGRGAQLEHLGLLPPGDLQGLIEERLRLVDRIAVHVEENLRPQPVQIGIVVVLSLLLGLREPEPDRAQGV